MNFRLMKKYMSFQAKNGLLLKEGGSYRITDKGVYFLQIYDQLNEMI
jgi:predicted transcriptional regulator